MKNYIKMSFILLLSIASAAVMRAQNITFYSPAFEAGVKSHIGLDSQSIVTQQHTDTITKIDLSGYGIEDIRDVVYLTNVRVLDLSHNKIRDISALLPLDSLHNVNLSNNLLEEINAFPFASTDSLVINIAYNYINDFSRLLQPSGCKLSIAGMAAQKERSATWLDVYQLFSDIDGDDLRVNYRGSSNCDNAYIVCNGSSQNATLDGNFHSAKLVDSSINAAQVFVRSDTQQGDSTWAVPIKIISLKSGEETTVETGLPDTYTLGSVYGQIGEVTVSGTSITYKASEQFEGDEVLFSYYEGQRLRGLSKIVMQVDEMSTGISKTEIDRKNMDLQINGNVLNVMLPEELNDATISIYDAAGHLYLSQKVTGINNEIILHKVPANVLIVEVRSGKIRFVDKVIIK